MDRAGLFSIGTIGKMFHLSVSSLRHYEAIGLLTPEYIDPESGYRYYSTRQFEVLNTIRYLRALDMPLQEISDFMENRDVERMEEKLLLQKQAVIENNIKFFFSEIVEANMFRFAKVSNREDDSLYRILKEGIDV